MLAMTEWGCVFVAGCGGGGENNMNLNLEDCCCGVTRVVRLG